MNLGRAIALCRKQRNLNQAALAKRAGMSVSYLSLLERNERKDPTLSTVQRLAEALHVPTGILFFLAAEDTELAGLSSEVKEKLSVAALSLLHEPVEATLL
jgi:transcriptional regulator with XRE-family HTH domain